MERAKNIYMICQGLSLYWMVPSLGSHTSEDKDLNLRHRNVFQKYGFDAPFNNKPHTPTTTTKRQTVKHQLAPISLTWQCKLMTVQRYQDGLVAALWFDPFCSFCLPVSVSLSVSLPPSM